MIRIGRCTSLTNENNAQWMLDALREPPQENVEEAFKNIFGYLFAKAIEYTENKTRRDSSMKAGMIADYTPEDAFLGVIRTELEAAAQKKVEEALALGKQFYKDFKFFIYEEKPDDDRFTDTMIRALIIVQRLGELYSSKCLKA